MRRFWALLLILACAIPARADVVCTATVSTCGGGGGGVAVTGTNVWTGDNRFTDSLFFLRDNGDLTKLAQFEASGISTATTRTYTLPNVSSTLAVLGLAQTFTAAQQFPAGTIAAPSVAVGSSGTGFFGATGSNVQLSQSGVATFLWAANIERQGSGVELGWTSTADPISANNDTGLRRKAAGVISCSDGAGNNTRCLLGGGAAVASATAMPLPTGGVFHVTGTTDITSITSTAFASGVCVTLIFDGVLNFTDGSNLKLSATMATTADDTISLCYDGTNWFETGRSVN